MAIGWRMAEDLETLSDLPDGSIDFNLLSGSATHSKAGPLDLWIAREMHAWLQHRFAADRISAQQILRAELRLISKTDRIKTQKKSVVSFDWDCHSLIATDQKIYESHLLEAHRWHNRTQLQHGTKAQS